MSTRIAGVLRDAFEEIADTAPPPTGLAPAAWARARRQRIALLTGGTGVAAAVCAVLLGVVGAFAPTGNGHRAAGLSDGLRPRVVTAYSGIHDPSATDGSPAFDYSLLLNPKTGRYDRVQYPFAMPSPDGRRVLVGRGDNSVAYPTKAGVMDRASGHVRWIPEFGSPGISGFPGYADRGSWSPDGRHILFTYQPKSGPPGLVLVDPDTLATKRVDLPDLGQGFSLSHGLALLWTSDSKALAMTRSHSEREDRDETVTGIRFFDLDGRLLRTVPAAATLGAFSPDGNRMALENGYSGQHAITIVDTGTGAVLHTIRLIVGTVVGWADGNHLLIVGDGLGRTAGTGSPPAADPATLAVVDLDGRVGSTIPLSGSAQQIYVGPSTGLPRSAARITF
jgi:hypothetical protein